MSLHKDNNGLANKTAPSLGDIALAQAKVEKEFAEQATDLNINLGSDMTHKTDEANEAVEIIGKILSALHDALDHIQNNPLIMKSQQTARYKKAKGNLVNFTKIVKNLPDNFEFIVYDVQNVPPETVAELRDDFSLNVKNQHLQKLAKTSRTAKQLNRMGLSRKDLTKLVQSGSCRRGPDDMHDLTVDHIIDLADGGKNEEDNLCALPGHVNSLKGDFISLQRNVLPDEKRRITFAPKNGVQVPDVAGGFRRSIESIDKKSRVRTRQRRENQFLGLS